MSVHRTSPNTEAVPKFAEHLPQGTTLRASCPSSLRILPATVREATGLQVKEQPRWCGRSWRSTRWASPPGRPLPRALPLPSRHLTGWPGQPHSRLDCNESQSPILPHSHPPSSQQPCEVGQGCSRRSPSDRPTGGRLRRPRHSPTTAPPPPPPAPVGLPRSPHPRQGLAPAQGSQISLKEHLFGKPGAHTLTSGSCPPSR